MMKAPSFSKSFAQGLVCAASGLVLCVSAQAASKISKADFDQTKATATSHYDASLEQCKSLSGNAKDVCKAQAKLEETKAISMAEARYKATAKATYSARKDIADAQYALGKEVCDDKAGNDKDVCRKEAKAAFEAATSNAKLKFKSKELIEEAAEDRTSAQYAVAKEKCDGFSGDAKDACVAKAKAEFGQ
jgi:hypothetical protein